MALAIIISLLLIVTGLAILLLTNSKRESDRTREAMKKWISIPSVLNIPNPYSAKFDNKVITNEPLQSNKKNTKSLSDSYEKIQYNYELNPSSQKRNLNKAIVYKSVTRRMTLVKVY